MKLQTLEDGNQPFEDELAVRYQELEASSRVLFTIVEKLHAIKSLLNDPQYWSRFPRANQDGVMEHADAVRLKLNAAWYSTRLAYLKQHDTIRAQAQALLDGPVAEARAFVGKTIAGPKYFVLHVNNVVAAEQLAQHVLAETERAGSEYARANEAARAAFEELFRLSIPYYEGRLSGGWKREGIGIPSQDHLGPAISEHMIMVPLDGQGKDLAAYNTLSALLSEAEAALQEMRRFKGTLNEESFGVRMQKVLKKPVELETLLADQHARRCHLASLQAHVVNLEVRLRKPLNGNGGYSVNDVYMPVAGMEDGAERQTRMNNALVLVHLLRRIYSWVEAAEAEQKDNLGLYEIAYGALSEAFMGEQPTPKVLPAAKQ